MSRKRSVLIVEDDESLRRVIEYSLTEAGYSVTAAENGKIALELFEKQGADVVITDIKMPKMNGVELVRRIRGISPDAMVIVITAFGTVATAVELMKLGAFDYITKPFNREELKVTVKKALDVVDLVSENRYLREMVEETYRFGNMTGASAVMKTVCKRASQVSKVDATVLVLGENGTGKELLVKAIHLNSLRKERPFVTVNCGSLPENLIESELFGYKKGSFTGAVHDKKGKFEEADEGTVFLDEIGELSLHSQVRLLRVLQDRVVDKIGSSESKKVDVRIIAATNRDIEEEIKKGNFREDLYYRLCVVTLKIPPLRERKEDIPLLTDHFIRKYRDKNRFGYIKVKPDALKILMNYKWPGNVRELENIIQGMVVMTLSGKITVEDLPERVRRAEGRESLLFPELPDQGVDLKNVEQELILKALEKCNQNQSKAARFLGITRNTLLYRIAKMAKPDPVSKSRFRIGKSKSQGV